MRKQPSMREVLSANLVRLMDEPTPPVTQVQVAKVAGVPQRTISRIKRGEVSPTLETLEAVAKAFNLAPWQLLVPNLDPTNPPILRAASPEEEALYKRLLSTAQELSKYKP